MDRDF